MSWTEAEEYFDGKRFDDSDQINYNPANYNPDLMCRPTAYAVAQGAFIYPNSEGWVIYPSDVEGCCVWWLRSPGNVHLNGAVVGYSGFLADSRANDKYVGVRPAILID